MAVPYSALVRALDVDQERESSTDLNLGDIRTLLTLESIIQSVTETIEGASGLNRRLIVRQYTDYIKYEDWTYDDSRDVYWVYAPQWPIVQIDTASFSSATPTGHTEAKQLTYGSRFEGSVTYYAGYKRSEQAVGSGNYDLQDDLSGLTSTPANLPYDIRDAAIDLVLYKMFERRHGPGVSTKVLNAAVQSTTLQGVRVNYVQEVMRNRIWHHRRLPC